MLTVTRTSIGWHWRWSLTWRWVLSWGWHRDAHKLGVHYLPMYGGQGMLLVWNNRLFDIRLQTQPNMARG